LRLSSLLLLLLLLLALLSAVPFVLLLEVVHALEFVLIIVVCAAHVIVLLWPALPNCSRPLSGRRRCSWAWPGATTDSTSNASTYCCCFLR